jgi:nucleolar protein 56
MSATYLLLETSSGFGLFEVVSAEAIGVHHDQVQKSVSDLSSFSKMIKLGAFQPFTSAENALDNINHISMGEVTPFLCSFLEGNLPSSGSKKSKVSLGVTDPEVGRAIQDSVGFKCVHNDIVLELLRGARLHFEHFIKALRPGDLHQSQLGLGHSYSRAKVKFNVNRVDNMIIQSIAILDQLDKDLNTFAMRVREWYSWHFPELVRIVNDNYQYCRLAALIKHKENLSEENLEDLTQITADEAKSQEILDAARMSMGTELSEIDMLNVDMFAKRVIKMAEYRKQLHAYLVKKMSDCAPNLAALIGEQVGARLISHAGSLTNLAKYPASTVQILGAEKALFRALKTKGNTPKYGLLFHSTFIGRAAPKNKGRISRYLANKCSIASRIDAFSDIPTNRFGEEMRSQVEERLEFYKSGSAPRKNTKVMSDLITELGGDVTAADTSATTDGASSSADADADAHMTPSTDKKKKKKKDKKKRKSLSTADEDSKISGKKRKAADSDDDENVEEAAVQPTKRSKVESDDDDVDSDDAPQTPSSKSAKKKKKAKSSKKKKKKKSSH